MAFNGALNFIRRGVGKRLEEHVGRFGETEGRYRKIPMRQYAVLNVTDEVPDQATLDMDDHVWQHYVHQNHGLSTPLMIGPFQGQDHFLRDRFHPTGSTVLPPTDVDPEGLSKLFWGWEWRIRFIVVRLIWNWYTSMELLSIIVSEQPVG